MSIIKNISKWNLCEIYSFCSWNVKNQQSSFFFVLQQREKCPELILKLFYSAKNFVGKLRSSKDFSMTGEEPFGWQCKYIWHFVIIIHELCLKWHRPFSACLNIHHLVPAAPFVAPSGARLHSLPGYSIFFDILLRVNFKRPPISFWKDPSAPY